MTDVAALAEIPTLEKLTVPMHAGNIEALHKLARLQMVAFRCNGNTLQPASTADRFWKDYGWISRLRESGFKATTSMRPDDGTWEVNLSNAAISDLTILSGAPISSLWLVNTAVTNLEPLRGMALKKLYLFNDKVTDIGPLKGMPLENLELTGTKVTDLSALHGMPLAVLRLDGCTELTDLSPLADCRELQHLILPPKATDIEFLRAFAKLKRIGFNGELTKNEYRPDKTAAEFWKEHDEQGWFTALRQSGVAIRSVKQLPDGSWFVDVSHTVFHDLGILHGAPISDLNIAGTAVVDLTPLRGMTLKKLDLNNTKVTDLSALRGMPLTSLWLFNCRKLTDLSPLADCKELQAVTLPPNAKNVEFLRAFPKLERISFQEDTKNGLRPNKTAAEFWKECDKMGRLSRALREAGLQARTVKQLADGTCEVDLTGSAVSDLKVLSGAPVSILMLGRTAVTDLEPLRGMALKTLDLTSTRVTDLSALRGMPLAFLWLHNCTEVTDISPVADCKELRSISLPPNAKNIEFLRTLPILEFIDYKAAAEFWRKYDATKK